MLPFNKILCILQDLQTLNTELIRYNEVNLTGFRLVTEENPAAEDIFKQMEIYERHTGAKLLNTSKKINVSTEYTLPNVSQLDLSEYRVYLTKCKSTRSK